MSYCVSHMLLRMRLTMGVCCVLYRMSLTPDCGCVSCVMLCESHAWLWVCVMCYVARVSRLTVGVCRALYHMSLMPDCGCVSCVISHESHAWLWACVMCYVVCLKQHNTRHTPLVRRILSSIRLTQCDMLPQQQVNIRKLISECF